MPIISTELQRAAYVAPCLQLSGKSTGFQRLPAEVDLFGIVFGLRGRSLIPYPLPPPTPRVLNWLLRVMGYIAALQEDTK